jgi:uncharacterized membrane protein YfcA
LYAIFSDVSSWQLLLVAAVALFASVVGGVTGYGSGALMPLVLVPLIGAEAVVPILSMSGLFNNASRVVAFWRYVDRKRAVIVFAAALPTCILGAYGYTRLTSSGAMIVIGTMLCLSVPFRRLLRHLEVRVEGRGLAAGAFGYGFLTGGTVGAGVILLSLLMAAGLESASVIATDAFISIAIGITKVSVYGMSGVVTAQVIAFALLIGLIALPGAFLARALVEALPVHVHMGILDAMVLVGGAAMIVGAFR